VGVRALSPASRERILAACAERDLPGARNGIARHLARIAITVMTHAVPEREPATIRAALQLVLGT
jgi:DNA-binding FadR family transcriptional regulator